MGLCLYIIIQAQRNISKQEPYVKEFKMFEFLNKLILTALKQMYTKSCSITSPEPKHSSRCIPWTLTHKIPLVMARLFTLRSGLEWIQVPNWNLATPPNVILSSKLNREVVVVWVVVCVVHGGADARVVGHGEEWKESDAWGERFWTTNFDAVCRENA